MDCKFLFLLIACAVSSTIADDCDSNFISGSRCTSRECNFYYEQVVGKTNLRKNRCTDLHGFACTRLGSYTTQELIFKHYESDVDNVIRYLNETRRRHDQSSPMDRIFSIEKALYKNCLKLGSELDGSPAMDFTNRKFQELQGLLISTITQNTQWQHIDLKLHKMGFGFAFFNVKVIPNPHDPNQNIIMIEPPSLTTLSKAYKMLMAISENEIFHNNSERHKAWNEGQDIFINEFIKLQRDKRVLSLYHTLVSALKEKPVKTKDHNMDTNILGWRDHFNRDNERYEVTEIKWHTLISHAFREAGVTEDIGIREPVYVKNTPYFAKLFNVLYHASNQIIGQAIVLKTIAENLRYIDWDLAQAIKPLDSNSKSSFCLLETNQYGASYKLLKRHGYLKLDKVDNEVLLNVIRSTRAEIVNSDLNFKESKHLSSELDSITADENYIWSNNNMHIFDYDSLSDSYFENIVNYRRSMRNNRLATLRKKPQESLLPFSIIDLAERRNRFTYQMHVMSNIHNMKAAPKPYYYATFGVEVATLLYELLNENKNEDHEGVHGSKLNTHPYYSSDLKKCFSNHPDDSEQTTLAISNAYGLQLAYKAMPKHSGEKDKCSLYFQDANITSEEQLFYLSFAQSNCDMDKSFVNTVVSQDEHFQKAFKCGPSVLCEFGPFDEIQEETLLTVN